MKRIIIICLLFIVMVAFNCCQVNVQNPTSPTTNNSIVGIWTFIMDQNGNIYASNSDGYNASNTSNSANVFKSDGTLTGGTYSGNSYTLSSNAGSYSISNNKLTQINNNITSVWDIIFENNNQNFRMTFASSNDPGCSWTTNTKIYFSKKQ
jgi:hypothetical protein